MRGTLTHPMLPKPIGNGCEWTEIETRGVWKEMKEVWDEIDEQKDTRNSENGATRGKKSIFLG